MPTMTPLGILTVCRGHTGSDVQKNRFYSPAECDQYLTDDMLDAIRTVGIGVFLGYQITY